MARWLSKVADCVGLSLRVYYTELDRGQPFKRVESCSIFSDSGHVENHIYNINRHVQATVKTIILHRIASENVLRSREAVGKATLGKRLHIHWVSDHNDIVSTEIADEVAKSVIHLAGDPVQNIQKSLETS